MAEVKMKRAEQAHHAAAVHLAAADQPPHRRPAHRSTSWRPPGRVPPDHVWATRPGGYHTEAERREALRQFTGGIDAAGRRAHRTLPASVHTLGKDNDTTSEHGIEATCFAGTRGSQAESMQNTGRTLRPHRDGRTKTARVIVPVFLQPGESPTDMVASASFRPLVAVLQALRSHGERRAGQLASRALTRSKHQRKVHVKRDAQGRVIGAGTEGDGEGQEQDDTDAAAEPALLHPLPGMRRRSPPSCARGCTGRFAGAAGGLPGLLRRHAENKITGLYAVPYDVKTTVGVTEDLPLGRRVRQQRKALRAGELKERRKELLDAPEAGMVWEPGEEAWEAKLAALRSYRRATGHLAPRRDAVWTDPADGAQVPIGQHMANLRRKGGLGKDPKRAAEHAAQLTAIAPHWHCPWPAAGPWPLAPGPWLATPLPRPRRPGRRRRSHRADRDPARRALRRRRPRTVAEAADELRGHSCRRNSGSGCPSRASNPPDARCGPCGQGHREDGREGRSGLPVRRRGPRPVHRPRRPPRVPRHHTEQLTVEGEDAPVTGRAGVWISRTTSRRGKLSPTRGQHSLSRGWSGPAWAVSVAPRSCGAKTGTALPSWPVTNPFRHADTRAEAGDRRARHRLVTRPFIRSGTGTYQRSGRYGRLITVSAGKLAG
ncbi:helicase associated domain-containing protein [Streptomyces sp. Ac-502]|uniref:helicase associated domain-containing protein n=1 Tax=Streptomyces sp. Ac-502 TaxID=3342801 RepID=UPI0038623525